MTDGTSKAEEVAKIFAEYNRLMGSAGSSQSNLTVNMGSWGVVVAAVAALFCAYVASDAKREVSDLKGELKGELAAGLQQERDERHHAAEEARAERIELRRNDADMRDYVSAIYQVAPEIQKRLEAEQAKAEK